MTRVLAVELLGGPLDGRRFEVPVPCRCVPKVVETRAACPGGGAAVLRFVLDLPPRERPEGGVRWLYRLVEGSGT